MSPVFRRRRAERLLVGMATATASPAHTEPSNGTLERARAVFCEMQQEYASGNFALLQQLESFCSRNKPPELAW